jgi:hypothetical protein
LEALTVSSLRNILKSNVSWKITRYKDYFDIHFKSTDSMDYELIPNYNFNNISLKKDDKTNHPLYLKLNKMSKKLFSSDAQGTHFYGDKYFFTLVSVFVCFYFEFLKVNKKFGDVFFKLGKQYYVHIGNKYFKNKNHSIIPQLLSFVDLYGFGKIEFVYKKKNEAVFRLTRGNLEKISQKLYPELCQLDYNPFKFGFMNAIIEDIYGKIPKKYETCIKNNMLYVTYHL